jgi:2-phosphosulfolactate phosphatase
MTDPPQAWATQSGFDVRLCWGPAGILALGREAVAVVLVDTLRFKTSLDVAVSRGAKVFPTPWPFDPARPCAGAKVADGSGPRGLGLSPAALTELAPGDRIVLPSANGSHCSALAAGLGTTVVGGSLRNAAAVARWLLRVHPGAPIAVVPCGERWPDGSLRPAVEDLVGAGSMVAALADTDPSLTRSPEARAADAVFRSAIPDLTTALFESASGRQLRQRGMGDDIAWAADLNSSCGVPVLGADGAYDDAAV